MKKANFTCFSPLVLGIVALVATPADAAVNLTGLGITPLNGNATVYSGIHAGYVFGTNVTGTKTLSPTAKLYYNIEDQNDTAGHGGALGPQFGGQDYDAEFLGAVLEGDGTLSINILTGQRFDNGAANFSPGDIRIATSAGDFWVEVGGSANAGGNIALGNGGSTYNVNSSTGVTTGQTTDTSPFVTAGLVVRNPGIINSPSFSFSMPAQIDPNGLATNLALSSLESFNALTYSYTFYTNGSNQHAGIEMSLNTAAFFGFSMGPVTINSVTWMPGCGNDVLLSPLSVVIEQQIPPPAVPEPASLLIWAGALTTVLGSRLNWRRRK